MVNVHITSLGDAEDGSATVYMPLVILKVDNAGKNLIGRELRRCSPTSKKPWSLDDHHKIKFSIGVANINIPMDVVLGPWKGDKKNIVTTHEWDPWEWKFKNNEDERKSFYGLCMSFRTSRILELFNYFILVQL